MALQIGISPQPVIALIAGILILLVPRLLSYMVAIYLIIFGILGLVDDGHSNLLFLKNTNISGKANEGISLAECDSKLVSARRK